MLKLPKTTRLNTFKLPALIGVAFCMQSCFTGVEGTNKITLSKKDITITAPSAEDLYLTDIAFPFLKDWQKGKAFLVADDKFRFVAEGAGIEKLHKGDTLTYLSRETRYSAGGGESATIIFSFNGNSLYYPVERKASVADSTLTSLQIPMLIDLDLVDSVRKKLVGKHLWTRSALWYDENLDYLKGSKFVEVTVEDVTPGNAFFPLLIRFSDREGKQGYFLMNTGNSGNESRSFSKLFSLTDPRKIYNHVSEENWKAIQNEELRIGMTKEECRLSKGNPSETDSGHSYSATMEIWMYQDGSLLRFVDGLLISYQ